MNREHSIGPLVAALFAGIIAASAALLAVSTQSWAQTLLVGLVGLLYLVFPPRQALPGPMIVLGALLVAIGAMAFLPEGWFHLPLRTALREHGIALATSQTLQPWRTLEDLSLLIATLCWGWTCLRVDLSRSQREVLIDAFLLVLGLIALAVIFHDHLLAAGLSPALANLGQFPNRNQTGDLLVMGGIFSLTRALSQLSARNWSTLFWLGLALVFTTAIVRNGSRASVLLFGFGALLLLAWRMLDRPSAATIGATLSLLGLAALITLAASGFALVPRFESLLSPGGEGRLAVYRDAAAVVGQAPWFGVGLGNFEGVFNTLRVSSAAVQERMLHPESDWWWLAVEMGFAGTTCAAVLVALIFRFLFVQVHQRGLVRGSAVVALLFFIHGFFDVGGHRMGTLWSCAYLVGLGIESGTLRRGWIAPALLLRAVGLALLALAALRMQSASLNPWMPTRASSAQAEMALLQDPPLDTRRALLDRMIAWAPLEWPPYFQRAVVELQQPNGNPAAEADFDRALFLEQSSIDLPTAIGQACLQADPPQALAAWQELLRRAGTRRSDLYWYLFPSVPPGKLRLQISAFAGDDADLQAIAVIWQGPENFDWMRHNLTDSNPGLTGVLPLHARQFFDHWYDVGNTTDLITEWPLHPEWRTPGWRAYVRSLARAGQYREAVLESLAELPKPVTPTLPPGETLAQATQDFHDDPHDAYRALVLYLLQEGGGQADQALPTLQAAADSAAPPPSIRHLLARVLLEKGRDEEAWKMVAPLLEAN